MANKAIVIYFLFLCILSCSSGFDFTLEHHDTDVPATSQSRPVCAVARCLEANGHVGGPGKKSGPSRHLTSLNVYKARLSRDGTGDHWEQLASLTPKQTDLNRVSDGIKVTGQLNGQQANISLELFKAHDCLESQFSCVAVFVDTHGRASVKKSFVGKALNSPFDSDLDPPRQEKMFPSSAYDQVLPESLFGSVAALAQMLGVIQAKLDRMDDAMKSIENRLEDKVGELDDKIDLKLDEFDLKIDGLQSTQQDKFEHVDTQFVEIMSQFNKLESVDANSWDQLSTKLDVLQTKEDESRKQLDKCVAEITKVSDANEKSSEIVSESLRALSVSIDITNRNLTNLDHDLKKIGTATDQLVATKATDNAGLTNLQSRVDNVLNISNDIVTEVNAFRTSYAGGALVPVEQYFDLLNTGKKEWRLAFRGTPYINVQVYPAFMHGTGIPSEVEQGCKQFNRTLPCANHYRNTEVFDNWAGVDEVLFGIFKDDRIVQRIVFNGKSSSYTTWFTEGRVIESSWEDLSTLSHLFFSITGDFDTNIHRRFYISHDHDKSCDGFRGWFLAGDTTDGCPVEDTVSFPTFFYATGKTFTVWPSATTGLADAIGIFIKYE